MNLEEILAFEIGEHGKVEVNALDETPLRIRLPVAEIEGDGKATESFALQRVVWPFTFGLLYWLSPSSVLKRFTWLKPINCKDRTLIRWTKYFLAVRSRRALTTSHSRIQDTDTPVVIFQNSNNVILG